MRSRKGPRVAALALLLGSVACSTTDDEPTTDPVAAAAEDGLALDTYDGVRAALVDVGGETVVER